MKFPRFVFLNPQINTKTKYHQPIRNRGMMPSIKHWIEEIRAVLLLFSNPSLLADRWASDLTACFLFALGSA